jgi:hypothetical protein
MALIFKLIAYAVILTASIRGEPFAAQAIAAEDANRLGRFFVVAFGIALLSRTAGKARPAGERGASPRHSGLRVPWDSRRLAKSIPPT